MLNQFCKPLVIVKTKVEQTGSMTAQFHSEGAALFFKLLGISGKKASSL